MPILINGTFGRNTPAELAESSDIKGSYLIATNLAALQGYTDLAVLKVGMLACAADTGLVYQLATINTPPSVPHIWNQFVSGSSIMAVWDNAVPWSTFYAANNIATLTTNGIIVIIAGDPDNNNTVDAGAYTNMQVVSFQALDHFRQIDVAQGATFDNMPQLISNVFLNSQSTSFVCTNPTQTIYIGYQCSIDCDFSVSGSKFISITHSGGFGGTQVVCKGAQIGHAFDLSGTANLNIQLLQGSSLQYDQLYGTSGTTVTLQFTAEVQNLALRSQFYNFLGTLNFYPLTDTNYLANPIAVDWIGSFSWADFYAQYYNAFPRILTVNLRQTGHTIGAGTWNYMDRVQFNSIDEPRTIDIAQDAVLDNIPILLNGVTLNCKSTTANCTNPTDDISVGYNCTLQCDPTVPNAILVELTGNTRATCLMDVGSIISGGTGSAVFKLSDTSFLGINSLNISQVVAAAITGVSGTTLQLAYDSSSPMPTPSTFSHFAGAISYIPLGDASEMANMSIVKWDGGVLFSDFYKIQNISSLAGSMTVSLTGTGHTIDNLGSAYQNMSYLSFTSIDTPRTINIANGATFTQLPSLFAQTFLNSQSTSYVVVNPTAPVTMYVGRSCGLGCSSSCTFVSMTSGYLNVYLNGGVLEGSQIFDITGTSNLTLTCDNIAYIDIAAIYGSSHLVLHYSNNTQIPTPSEFTNFTGEIDYTPSSDANNQSDVAIVNWNGVYLFSDFYKMQNISALTGAVIVELVGSGHTIDNMGSKYIGLNNIYLDSGMVAKSVIIQDGVTMDAPPNLWRNVILMTSCTSFFVTNPAGSGSWYIGSSSAFTSALTIEGGTFYGILSNSGTFGITLDDGSISTSFNAELLRCETASVINVNIANNQSLATFNQGNIYGSGSGIINLYSNGSYILPDPTSYTNFVGTVNNNYFGLCPTPDEKDGLDASNSMSAANPAATMADISSTDRDNTQIIGQLNPEANNWFFDNTITKATSDQNPTQINVLNTIPSGMIEYLATINVNAVTPVLHAAFLYPIAMNWMAGFKAGVTSAKIWASADNITGTTQLICNGMNFHTYAGTTVTLSGTGTTRTATASAGIFYTVDGNPNPAACNYLNTPAGTFQITYVALNGATQATIRVPSTYTNEVGVAIAKFYMVSSMISPNITNTSIQEYTCFSNPNIELSPVNQNWIWGDKYAIMVFAQTTLGSYVTVTLAYDGYTRYSHIETPANLKVTSIPIQVDHTGNYHERNVAIIVVGGSSTSAVFNFSIPQNMYQLLDARMLLFTSTNINSASIDTDTSYTNSFNGTLTEYTGSGSVISNLIGPDIIQRIPFSSALTNAIAGSNGALAAGFNTTGSYYVTNLELSYIYYQ